MLGRGLLGPLPTRAGLLTRRIRSVTLRRDSGRAGLVTVRPCAASPRVPWAGAVWRGACARRWCHEAALPSLSGDDCSTCCRWPCKRLVRRTICFSKTERMHDLVLGLFINRYEFGVSVLHAINRSETSSVAQP